MAVSLPIVRIRRAIRAADHPIGIAADALETGFVCFLICFTLTSWGAFVLAEFGRLRPLFLVTITAASLLASLAWRRGCPRLPAPAVLGGLLISIAACLCLFFPPDEWILGGLDPGGYVSAGAAIARDGSIVQPAPEVAALPQAIQNALFIADGNRLSGWYLVFPKFQGLLPAGIVVSSDRSVPHGFHLFPVVLSFGSLVGGIRGELLVPPLLALMAVIAFFLLVRRILGFWAAALSSLFLVVNPAEIWFARYPDGEILAQILLFGGLFCWVLAEDTDDPWLGALAGISIGLVHLAKIETIPLVGIILIYCLYRVVIDKFTPPFRSFLIAYVVVLAHAILHAILIAWWYTTTTLQLVTSPHTLLLSALGIGVGLLAITALATSDCLRLPMARFLERPDLRRALGIGVPAVIGILALYAYFVRPLPALAGNLGTTQAAVPVANNLESFVRLGWFVTPLGLIVGTLGFMLLARYRLNLRTALLLLLVASDSAIFLTDMRITPVYYWAARRWVPLVIPGFALAAGFAISFLFLRLRDRRFGIVVPTLLGVGMLVGLLTASRPLFGYVEYRGAVDQVGQVASMLPTDSVTLLVDGDSGIRLSVPLQYIYGRTSFVVKQDASTLSAIRAASQTWLQQGKPVYWITTADLPGPSEIGMSGVIVARQRISLPEKLVTRDTRPGADGQFQQDLIIWRLTPDPARSQTP